MRPRLLGTNVRPAAESARLVVGQRRHGFQSVGIPSLPCTRRGVGSAPLPCSWPPGGGSWLLGPGRGWPSLELIRQEGIWDLGWSFTSRILLGSTLVGLVASTGFSFLYWAWLERSKGEPVVPS